MKRAYAALLFISACQSPLEPIEPIKVAPITGEDLTVTEFQELAPPAQVETVNITNREIMFALSYYDSPACVTRESLDYVSPVRNDFYMEQGDGVVYYLAMYRPLDPYSWYEGVMFYEYQSATGLWCVWGSTLAGEVVTWYRNYF